MGVEPDFNERLEALRQNAIRKGLWEKTYAVSNKEEYFEMCIRDSYKDCWISGQQYDYAGAPIYVDSEPLVYTRELHSIDCLLYTSNRLKTGRPTSC